MPNNVADIPCIVTTSPGQIARDGKGKRNGEYTSALLQHIGAPDCTIEAMFKRVRNTLSVATGGKQISWEHTSLASDFYFNRSVGSRIDEYSTTALKDALFEYDAYRPSHDVTHHADLFHFTFLEQPVVVVRNLPYAACDYSLARQSMGSGKRASMGRF
ncbi:caspase family protein [Pseudomonas edaphica]|uniref:Caspase family protein n=1 Tax=Pseudomonas edaphica TaxID=2006980 RepID=A0A7Y8K9R9_9PSED|nr:caspase family protein [Pseudomonas koreensis]NWC47135.1 caspase family protein [Pseudomonas sp. IPO3747]NWE09725.1 caspase family protein [Pseudomonas edaphica]NWE80799.1 caspase family protein [Pseudomonas edaphica]